LEQTSGGSSKSSSCSTTEDSDNQSPVTSVPREGKATLVEAVSVYRLLLHKLGSSIVEEEAAGGQQGHTAKTLGRWQRMVEFHA